MFQAGADRGLSVLVASFLAYLYSEQKDYTKGARVVRDKAAAPRAMLHAPMFNLGQLYENGHGVEKLTSAKAREWYEKAAERGDEECHGLILGLPCTRTVTA